MSTSRLIPTLVEDTARQAQTGGADAGALRRAASAPTQRGPMRVLWLFFFLVVSGCSRRAAVPGEKVVNVAANEVVRSPMFGRLEAIAIRGPYIWVADGSGNPFLHVIDLRTKAIVRSFGRSGDGPGDFHGIFGLFPAPNSDSDVVAYDLDLHRLTTLRVREDGRTTVQQVTQLANFPFVSNIAPLNGSYVGWVEDPGPRWELFGNGLTPVLIPGPLIGPASAPLRERISASSNMRLCAKPDGRRFAVLYGSAGRIELHDAAAALITVAAVPDASDGHFQRQAGGVLRWRRQRFYYSACAATNRFLFALFSGRDARPPATGFDAATQIEVYSWDGLLKGVLRTSAPIRSLAVDSSGGALYGAGASGQSAVYEFDIPRQFSGTDE